MGIVWEAYHKGVPLLGVHGITLGYVCFLPQTCQGMMNTSIDYEYNMV